MRLHMLLFDTMLLPACDVWLPHMPAHCTTMMACQGCTAALQPCVLGRAICAGSLHARTRFSYSVQPNSKTLLDCFSKAQSTMRSEAFL